MVLLNRHSYNLSTMVIIIMLPPKKSNLLLSGIGYFDYYAEIENLMLYIFQKGMEPITMEILRWTTS